MPTHLPLSMFRCRRRLQWALLLALMNLLAACVTLTESPRALISGADRIAARTLPCPTAAQDARTANVDRNGEVAIDAAAIRVVTWNIHKAEDAGWRPDLERFAANSDILLLQEVTLHDSVQQVLQAASMRWVMASSFIYDDLDIGVLTATRVMPVASCTQRFVEPLLRLPKSAVITWLPLTGTRETLAVANVHSINFSLSLETYQMQLATLGDALVEHEGPVIVGGDLNTWTRERQNAVHVFAQRLRLAEIPLADDRRTLFLGNQVDHLLVRGLDVVSAQVTTVTSSDHNPVAAVLRVPPRRLASPP
ncbi:MAG: endonuclease/exonuclease/phosphatase family protein [Burkholderiales bacterium]|nr:endonuclease/exonuclease/phosphatase family protein [Burkholderiales bacterium]